MRIVWLVAVAGCSTSNAAPGHPHEAWQAFSVGPFRSMYGGHTRASWPVGVAAPKWLPATFANLELTSYDGVTLTGEVSMWTTSELDPNRCAVEVVWDGLHKRGIRIDRTTSIDGDRDHVNAHWRFVEKLASPPPIVAATAFVFCPIDDAHRTPPWGAHFYSIEMVVGGPNAKREMCRTQRSEPAPVRLTELGRTIDIAFACGVLPRLRGRTIIDDCRDDVLLSIDALGPAATTVAPPTGTPPDESELRQLVGGNTECRRLTFVDLDKSAQPLFDAAIRRLGSRVVYVGSRDGIQNL